jgi:L-iditol 2-dehydrogenase
VKVARYYSRDDIRVEDAPLPRVGPGEILVRVQACGLCGSDLLEWYVETKAPAVLGHEPAGLVTQVGQGVEGFQVGDPVFVHHHVPCFVCHHCVRGYYTLCETFKATHLDPGGFAEYVRVPALNVQRDVLKLPPEMPFDHATLIEPLATCLRSMDRAGLQTGDAVAVVGAGFTGLLHVQLARLYGAGRIVATDLVDFRLEMALQLGADAVFDARGDVVHALHALNDGRGADAVFVTPGTVAAMEQGLALAGGGGTVVLFAPTPPETTLPVSPYKLLFSEITLTASYSCSPLETRQALALLQGGRIDVEGLITHRFGLEGVGEAMRLAKKGGQSLKIVITP